MTADFDDLVDLSDGVDALQQSLGEAGGMAAAFQSELQRINRSFETTSRTADKLERSLSRGVARAIDDVVLDGARFSDALKGVAETLVNAAWRAAVKPVADQAGGALAQGVGAVFGDLLGFAKGGSFVQGRVVPFAKGGVVDGPTTFPMRGATGLMGEAGPEAIMPLTRGPDGALGVRAEGGGRPIQITMNIATPDVAGFQRSQSQIAARMSRALSLGAKNR